MKVFLSHLLKDIGTQYAEIRIEETDSTVISLRGADLDDANRSFERGGCLRVFHHGNWGVATFNAFDNSLKGLVQDTAAQVESLPARDAKLVPLGACEEQLEIRPDDDPREVRMADKLELLRHYNQILLDTPGIATTNSSYADALRSTAFYSTEGRFVEQQSVRTGFSCRAVARDGANIQEYGESFGKSLGIDSLRNREPLVERVAKTALDLLRAKPVEAGVYDVVIDPLLGGVFCHEAFGHLSEADHIADNERLMELMEVGARFGSDELTIVDDATLPGERGSYAFDDEGTASSRVELVRQGVLAGRLHDRETAMKLNEPATGNGRAMSYRFPPIVRMSNTFIAPGKATLEEMLGSMKRGLYVCGSRGGMTELESFTFASQYAWLVEKGRKTSMVRDVTLSGNVFETLRNITAIGNDLVMYGGLGGCGKEGQGPLPVGLGAPHLKVKGVVIGGR